IVKDSEMQWVERRGGTIFAFGRPGHAEQFRYALAFIVLAIGAISPFFFTLISQSIGMVKHVSHSTTARHTEEMTKRVFAVLSLQLLNTLFVFLLPISILCLFTVIDTSPIPGVIFAPLRSFVLLLFCLNPTQISLVFIIKNPIHRK
ncbi:hypothetical protein PFISCL1PPCAC_13647, partial [Pristionchus fissidentatus]